MIAGAAVGIAALLFGLEIWRGEPLREILMTAVSLSVAAIPEGLPEVIILQGAVVFLPIMQSFFKTTPLSLEALVWVVMPSVAVFTVLELEKLVSKSKAT